MTDPVFSDLLQDSSVIVQYLVWKAASKHFDYPVLRLEKCRCTGKFSNTSSGKSQERYVIIQYLVWKTASKHCDYLVSGLEKRRIQ